MARFKVSSHELLAQTQSIFGWPSGLHLQFEGEEGGDQYTITLL